MDVKEKYVLNPKVTNEQLHNEGFRRGVFKCHVFKGIIQLVVYIDTDEKWWGLQICDTDSGSLYTPYYDRKFGTNAIVKKIDQKVSEILQEMAKKNILKKRHGVEEK